MTLSAANKKWWFFVFPICDVVYESTDISGNGVLCRLCVMIGKSTDRGKVRKMEQFGLRG